MIELYQSSPCWGLPDLSPFCIKLHTYFRIAKLPYEVSRELTFQDAPKGKIPFIRYNSQLMGDSNLIIDYLNKTLNIDPDEHLSQAEKAVSLAFTRLIEENLYWVAVYSLYKIEDNWLLYRNILKELIFKPLPEAMQNQFLQELNDQVLQQLWGHGMGRHSEPEIYEIGRRDLSALSDFLGDKPFFMGKKPPLSMRLPMACSHG
ncbi:MAG TPA: glutathione S-transferase family protein [Stenomitos sp.]